MGIHIVKRDNCPLWKKCALYAGAVVIALVLGGVLLLLAQSYSLIRNTCGPYWPAPQAGDNTPAA